VNKKNEEKILEELRKRVLEKDKELQERSETSSIINSNKDALAEMTNLSRTDVDAIEKQIRAELQLEVKKSQKRRTWYIIAAVVVGFIAFRIIMKKLNQEPEVPPYHFVESFDNNNNAWDIFNTFDVKRNIENGSYTFVGNKDEWCYWDNFEIQLPQDYSIEMKSKWRRGAFDEFGLMLMESSNNYYTFVVRADGNTAHAIYRNPDWLKRNSWKPVAFKNNEEVTQKIEVRGSNFSHYVAGKLYHSGKIEGLEIKEIALRVCDKQTIDFLEIQVKNIATGEILFSDKFDESSANWDEKQSNIKESKLEKGSYIFTTNEEDQCYWAVSNTKIALPTINDYENAKYTVKVQSTWLSGEEADYGIMLMADDANYTAFQLRNSGDVRAVRCENEVYTLIDQYTPTGYVCDGKTPITIVIKVDGNNYQFFVNDKLINSGDFNYKMYSYLALRVCGRQTIAFDHIEITEDK